MIQVIEEYPAFHTAKDFLAALRPSDSSWSGDDDTHTGWIFRGQASSRWRLRPSLFRRQSRDGLAATYLRIYRKKYREDFRFTAEAWHDWVKPTLTPPGELLRDGWDRRLSHAALHALSHAALVRDFVLLADRAGHPIIRPDFLWHLTNRDEHKNALGTFFRGDAHQDDLVAFAIAQHHGVPTGLIDWTYNPLVAAFFAAEALAEPVRRKSGSYIAVWALRTVLFRSDSREIRRLTVPPGRVPFLDAQGGLFTWCPSAYERLVQYGRYPTVESLVKSIASAASTTTMKLPLLRKLILPVEQVPALLKLLWREQVTRAHLMPTFDNVTLSMRLRATWQEEAR